MQCGGLDDPFPIQVFRRRLAIRQYWSGGPDPTLWICPPFDQRLCNVLLGVNIGTFPMTDLIAPVPDVPTAALQSCVLQVALVRGQAELNAVPLRILGRVNTVDNLYNLLNKYISSVATLYCNSSRWMENRK